MPVPDSDPRTSLITRRSIIALAAGGAGLLAVSAAFARSNDDDDHNDDHEDDDHDDHGDMTANGTVPAGSAEVQIVDDDHKGFSPGTITVDLGQSVTFVNLDDKSHTATGSTFDTGRIDPGDQATITFDEAGSFPYACQYHPAMTGVVEVRDENGMVPGASASPVASPVATEDIVEITIASLAFHPAEIEISAGSTVEWINQDSMPHTATSTTGAFDTGTILQNGTARHTFDNPGTFPYFCAFHTNMTGTITVV